MLPMYLLHHVIVIFVYGSGLIRQKCHFWGALNALCEATNIFCTVIEIFACCPRRARTHDFRLLYKINSALFGLSYCLLRLALFPVLLYAFMNDCINHPETAKQYGSTAEFVFYPIASVLVFGLSVRWAVPVVKGTLRTVFGMEFDRKDRSSKLMDAAEVAANEAAVAVGGEQLANGNGLKTE